MMAISELIYTPNDNGLWFSHQKGIKKINAHAHHNFNNCCPIRILYQMMFISSSMGVTNRAGTACKPTQLTLGFCRVRVAKSLVFCAVVCESLFA